MIAWIQRTLTSSATGAPSTKRLVFLASASALIVSMLGLTWSCARWILGSGDLGAGAVGALLGIAASVAALAGVGYRKGEVGVAAPPAASQPSGCVEGGSAKIGGAGD